MREGYLHVRPVAILKDCHCCQRSRTWWDKNMLMLQVRKWIN